MRRGPAATALAAARSGVFWAGMAAATVVWSLVSIAARPLPFERRFRTVAQWNRFVLWWLRLTCGLGYRVEGRGHLPRTGAAVVLSKHQSAWETIAYPVLFPPQAIVLKRELLRIPFFGWGLAVLEPIAIDRGSPRQALKQLIDQGVPRLRQGRWMVIFPEGTRVRPGERRPYQPGGAMVAIKAGVPVVPVAHDAGRYWPRRGWIKWPGTIRVVIGPPIATAGRKAQEVMAEAEAWIEATCARLAAEGTEP